MDLTLSLNSNWTMIAQICVFFVANTYLTLHSTCTVPTEGCTTDLTQKFCLWDTRGGRLCSNLEQTKGIFCLVQLHSNKAYWNSSKWSRYCAKIFCTTPSHSETNCLTYSVLKFLWYSLGAKGNLAIKVHLTQYL